MALDALRAPFRIRGGIRSLGIRRMVWGWGLSSPYLLFTLVFFLIPLIWSLVLVFLRWDLISPAREFVGLQNFATALRSERVFAALVVTYKFMALFIPIAFVVSMILALIVHNLPRFKVVFAIGFFLPFVSSGVAVALVVRGFLSYNSALGVFLRDTFGSSPNWLGNEALAVIIISLMIVWKFSGYFSLIFLAGLQSIPEAIYEAADLDGAGSWAKFWKITLPMMYPAVNTMLILSVGTMFSVFTEPFMLTGGGPSLATHTWQLELYQQVFENFQAGYGATIAFINAVVILISIIIVRHIMEKTWGRRYGWAEE